MTTESIARRSIPDRLRQVEPTVTEPEPLWEMKRICAAFMVNIDNAARYIPKECKHRHRMFVKDWRFMKFNILIDRRGIEALAIRYNRQFARHEIMRAVDDSINRDGG